MPLDFAGAEEEVRQARARHYGKARSGVVYLEDFVEGLMLTMGAKLGTFDKNPNDPYYFVSVPGIDTKALGLEGVPITQSYPEDVFNEYQVPYMFLRFDTLDAALERQHSGQIEYRVEDPTAPEIPNSGGKRSRVIERAQSAQYDLMFTLVVEGRSRFYANKLLNFVQSVYPSHASVFVKDSVGDFRDYYLSASSGAPEDEIFDIADRTFGFSFPLRIMGELGAMPERIMSRVGGSIVPTLGPK